MNTTKENIKDTYKDAVSSFINCIDKVSIENIDTMGVVFDFRLSLMKNLLMIFGES